MTNAIHSGGCLCGQVRYAFADEPLIAAVCHCRHCQRQSGSAFSLVIAVTDAAFSQQGETRVFEDVGDSGQPVSRHFCGTCGSPIVSIAGALPGLTLIKGGTLDEPGRWTPTLEAYCDGSLPWLPPVAAERHARSNIGE